jgi:hypothetical protein
MEKGGSKGELYNDAKRVHTSLDLRLQMLLKKAYLSDREELEMKLVKKRKLYYKDMMERLQGGIEEQTQ